MLASRPLPAPTDQADARPELAWSWPVAQVSPLASRTGRRHSSCGDDCGGPRVQPVALGNNQQVHVGVRHHGQHQTNHQRLAPLAAMAAARQSPLSHYSLGPSGLGVYGDGGMFVVAARHHQNPTRAAFSTADIRRALRLLAASRNQPQAEPLTRLPLPKTKTTTTTTRTMPRQAPGWQARNLTRTTRQSSELSPRCLATTAKFKSSDSERQHQEQLQQSEKNDLRQARIGGGRNCGAHVGHLESYDCGGGGSGGPLNEARVVVVASTILTKSLSDDEIRHSRGERGVRLVKSCLFKAKRERGAPVVQVKRSKPIDDSTTIRSNNKLCLGQFQPSESYANARQLRQTQLVSGLNEVSIEDEEDQQQHQQQYHSLTTRSNCQDEEATRAPSETTEEAMTTGSFVSTEPLSRQQVCNQNLEPEELAQQQQQQSQQFNLALHQQSARPIGLGCAGSASTSSASLSSEDRDQDERDDELSHQKRNKANELASSMNQATERYTIISSSSVVSLSDNSNRAEQYGGSAAAIASATGGSSSTTALNQRGTSGGKNLIGKFVGKKASRIRELLLQNLGRADRTTDELFDLCELNFYKQQQHVQQLMKEFKLYTNALKTYHEASRNLSKCIQQSTSDYQLARHDLACDNLSQLDQLNEDLMEKLHERVIKSLSDYLTRFDEIKEKINKRHRKLIDYDSSRRLYELMFARVSKKRSSNMQPQQQPQQQQQNYQSILRGLKFLSQQQQQQQQQPANHHHTQQESAIASQLVDEARLLKLREQYNYCKLMYETINGELHDEMPIVYERKMKSLLNALQNYYDIEAHYHLNAGKLIAKVSEVMAVVKPQSANDEGSNTMLSMYDKSADDKRETSGAGSGSSGVSLSGSASRSSGSSLASPDCDDQHCRQTEHNDDVDDDDDGDDYEDRLEKQQQLLEDPKSGERPDDLEGSVRFYVEVSPKSGGEQADDSPSASNIDGSPGVADEQTIRADPDDDGENEQEEQQTPGTLGTDKEIGDEARAEKPVLSEADESQVGVVKIESVPAAVETAVEPVSGGEVVVKVPDADVDAANDEPDNDSEQKGYLYRVRTNYKYLAEDVDELCFDANEIIQVIEFDENHEPEDGWLLGIREMNNQRGLFPANFTQPI